MRAKRLALAFLALLLAGEAYAQRPLPAPSRAAASSGGGGGGGGSSDTGDIVWTCTTVPGDWPQCGAATADGPDGNWTRSQQLSIGPQGQHGERITHVGTTDTTLQYYSSRREWTGPTPAQGDCVNFRIVFRINAPLLFNDNAGGRFGLKFALVGQDGTNDVNRGFINLRSNLADQDPVGDHDGSHAMIRIQKNTGVIGDPDRTDIFDLTSGVWYFLQVEFKSSTTDVATNATIKAWLNNNTYASPTSQSAAGFAWPVVGWQRVGWGFYGESLGLAGNAQYDQVSFVYNTDPSCAAIFKSDFYQP